MLDGNLLYGGSGPGQPVPPDRASVKQVVSRSGHAQHGRRFVVWYILSHRWQPCRVDYKVAESTCDVLPILPC